MTRQDAQSPYRLGEIGRLSQTGSMSTQACSAVSALAACWRGISALALCCLELACAAAPPPASASSPAPVAGEEPQQLTLYPGTPESRAFLEQIHQSGKVTLTGRCEELRRQLLDLGRFRPLPGPAFAHLPACPRGNLTGGLLGLVDDLRDVRHREGEHVSQ